MYPDAFIREYHRARFERLRRLAGRRRAAPRAPGRPRAGPVHPPDEIVLDDERQRERQPVVAR